MSLVKVVTVVPLWNVLFQGNSRRLRIDADCSIRPLSPREKSVLEEHLGLYLSLTVDNAIAVEWEQNRPKLRSYRKGEIERWLSRTDNEKGYRKAARVIEGMRLFSAGAVGTTLYINLFSGGKADTGFNPALMTGITGNPYFIIRAKRRKLRLFVRSYLGWSTKHIDRHLRRFLKAYTQSDFFDRLVDFVTSMEGLVLPDTRDELRKQFSLRIAWLLGKSRTERKRIFKEAIDVYDLRSAIVHGGRPKKPEKDFSLCFRGEELNRKLLVLALEKPDKFKKEALQDLVLG